MATREELLTVGEVAEYLKLNQQTVRNMIDRGELRSLRVGVRRVRIRQSELDRFLAAGEADDKARDPELSAGLTAAADAKDSTELAAALRSLAATAERLADGLERGST
jgi:excisionase family DNA binding protein